VGAAADGGLGRRRRGGLPGDRRRRRPAGAASEAGGMPDDITCVEIRRGRDNPVAAVYMHG
jgi:hypothetical protein